MMKNKMKVRRVKEDDVLLIFSKKKRHLTC